MAYYEKELVRIWYEDLGTGVPLLLIAGGGLNGTIQNLRDKSPFDPVEQFSSKYRCIMMDLRNANTGKSTGPLEIERPWDAYSDDQIGLMDHLDIDKFLVLGFCIGGPFIWNLLQRIPNRIIAAVLVQPSGYRPEIPDLFYQNNIESWAPQLCKKRPDISMEMTKAFLGNMYRKNADFVFTASREFVSGCKTPILILPDDVPGHPYEVAMESALLAPNAQVSFYPWKEPMDRIPLAIRHIQTFLSTHEVAANS